MATTTITVQEIRPPKPGGKKYVIVDATDTFYYIWPDKVANYQVGQTYDINYSSQDFRGSTIRSIDSAQRSTAAPQTPSPRPASNAGGGGGGYNTYRETSAADKASMFVTALMKAAVQAQMVDIHNAAEIAQIGKNFKDAHAMIWAPPRQAPQQQAGQQRNDDMNDQIPF